MNRTVQIVICGVVFILVVSGFIYGMVSYGVHSSIRSKDPKINNNIIRMALQMIFMSILGAVIICSLSLFCMGIIFPQLQKDPHWHIVVIAMFISLFGALFTITFNSIGLAKLEQFKLLNKK